MIQPKHTTAKPSHYNKEADTYDTFNEKNSVVINAILDKTFQKHKVRSILDLSCGTGSQVFWLSRCGYEVVGVDINAKMLKIAREKARKQNQKLKFIKGDMRSTQQGVFDAVVTIFNSVGHLTKKDFLKTMENVYDNLNEAGLYVFDIFNLDYLQRDNNITKLTIDWQKRVGERIVREIQYSTIDDDGILASYDFYFEKKDGAKPKTSTAVQTLQVYSADQLREMLNASGFKVLSQCDIDGSRFYHAKSERILTVAKKV